VVDSALIRTYKMARPSVADKTSKRSYSYSEYHSVPRQWNE
jgi:hypothetical protein